MKECDSEVDSAVDFWKTLRSCIFLLLFLRGVKWNQNSEINKDFGRCWVEKTRQIRRLEKEGEEGREAWGGGGGEGELGNADLQIFPLQIDLQTPLNPVGMLAAYYRGVSPTMTLYHLWLLSGLRCDRKKISVLATCL